ncbi:MAG: nitrilase, partial [Bacteroidetes bacterium]|nr:nitrilase [Bacteroidota bacterium]
MRTLNIAVAQFEPKDGDKKYNLSVIEKLTAKAKEDGAEAVSFHELCITAYTHLKDLSKQQLDDLSEEIPDGKSTQKLIQLSKKYNIPILAGLVEKDGDRYYNSYICVDQSGVLGKHRKIHPFISEYLSAGEEYTVFDLNEWKCGILICYDNSVIENARATTLLGAELIFAPHVTMCTPSSMPGRGYVDDKLWENRDLDPVPL